MIATPGRLYPFGYTAPASVQQLETLMSNPRMLLIDVRYAPYSRLPAWRQNVLQTTYGARYRYAGQFLGNINYRSGGPIRLANQESGIKGLLAYLREGYHLILLCACKDYEMCHRKVIVEAVQQQLPNVAVHHPSFVEKKDMQSSTPLALSLCQPYAHWLTHPDLFREAGLPPKAIENREWNTSYRGSLLIHASRTFDTDALPYWQMHFPQLREIVPQTQKEYPCGAIVGRAELVGVVEQSTDPWFFGRYGFVLVNAVPLEPYPYPGQLKFFSVPGSYLRHNEQ